MIEYLHQIHGCINTILCNDDDWIKLKMSQFSILVTLKTIGSFIHKIP